MKDVQQANGNAVKTLIGKRSVVIEGRKTSISLENEFWDGLQEIAVHLNLSTSALVGKIIRNMRTDNRSSAIRVFVFEHFRGRSSDNSSGIHSENPLKYQLPNAGRGSA